MAAITYDGQSFIIDGRRIWLVAGTIDYARCPHQQWAARIHAAKSAGLNTIVTSVPWSRHEPRAGQFDFTGDANLRHFVEMIGAAGLYCVLRVGPFIGGGFDLGGIPPWVLSLKDVALRTQNSAFLEACSRFIGAVARQVRDLQAIPVIVEGSTQIRPAGPIVLVQNESGWRCGHDDLARGYLGELNRYLHESGFEVPIINANDLWAGVEGEVDCWTGRQHLLANLRQLAQVRTTQPRFLAEYRVSEPPSWGGGATAEGVPTGTRATPAEVTRDLCEALCAGAQYTIEPFFGGTNFGFLAGRLGGTLGGYAITSNDLGAPLRESGAPGDLFPAVRRVSMFASRFGRVLSALDARHAAATLLPGSVELDAPGQRRHAVVHCSGSQGHVAFVFGSPPAREQKGKPRPEPVPLLLPSGAVLPVHMGQQAVSWVLFDVRLAGRSQLDYCNLTPFALVGKVFVCAGPAGSPARLSINGSPLDLTVPTGPDPEIIDHENILVVICCDEHLDAIQVADDAVYIGAPDLTSGGEPIVHDAKTVVTRLGADGEAKDLSVEVVGKGKKAGTPVPPPPPPPPVVASTPPPKGKLKTLKPAKGVKTPPPPPPPEPKPARVVRVHLRPVPSRLPVAPALGHWTSVSQNDYLDGTSARYASIAGPADLNALGAPYGYGWYRLRLRNAASRRVRLAWPHSADRLHLFIDGKGAGVVGDGPGAQHEIELTLRKGDVTIVALAENMGRASSGQHLGERKGAFGHAMHVEPLRVSKPSIEQGDPLDVMAFKAPIQGVSRGDVTDSHRLGWDLPAKRAGAIIIRLRAMKHRGLMLLNDAPIAFFDRGGPECLVLESDRLSRGHNRISVALLGDTQAAADDLAESISFSVCEDVLTVKAEWAFAKWEPPTPEAMRAGAKRSPARGDVPTWHHAEFTTSPGVPAEAVLFVDTTGLSKGQIYVNGRHLGRYFTAAVGGKAVGPQTRFIIPAPYLHAGKPNDLVIFDEHGFAHGRLRLGYRY